MVFSSLEFLFLYLPVVIVVYYVSPLKLRNVFLLIASLAFYGWGEPRYVFVMIFNIAVNYVCGYFIEKYRENDGKKARAALIASIVISLAALGFFKYMDFFIDNLRMIPALSFLRPVGIVLPIGISFYTFQTISYTIDLYRGDCRYQSNPVYFGTYVALFPQLVAGPIVRYKDIDEQLDGRKTSVIMFANGVRTFVAGLGKKVLLANTAGMMWDYIKALPGEEMSAVTAWLGIIAYTFQIYFDFSGYSDMAIGLGKMFGFVFLENFNYPYISQSITDFWRRWHISLSTWFREYIYIPLGGNRRGLLMQYRNIAVVWLLTGFWHGASWNFVLWGVYFGVILMLEKRFILKWLEKVPRAVRHVYALFLIVFGWLIFSFEDIGAGARHFGYMFGTGGMGFADGAAVYDLIHFLPFLAVFAAASTPYPKMLFNKYFSAGSTPVRIAVPIGAALLLMIGTAFLVDSAYNPFLYFRF